MIKKIKNKVNLIISYKFWINLNANKKNMNKTKKDYLINIIKMIIAIKIIKNK